MVGAKVRAQLRLEGVLAALIWIGCGRVTRDEPLTVPDTVCDKFCEVRQMCGLFNESCASECAWFEEQFGDAEHTQCYESTKADLDCIISDPSRLSCMADGVTASLSGCPERAAGPCIAGSLELGRLYVAVGEAMPSCPMEVTREIGVMGDNGTGVSVLDGLQDSLYQFGGDDASFSDVFLDCEVTETAIGFDFSGVLRSGSTTFEVRGEVDDVGQGYGHAAYRHELGWPTLQNSASMPCLISVRSDSRGAWAISDLYVHADFACIATASASSPEPLCQFAGTFRFEGCHPR
jgi:hypothetical protein